MTLLGANGAGSRRRCARSTGCTARARVDPLQRRGHHRDAGPRDREARDRAVARGAAALPAHDRDREPRDGRLPAQRQGRDPGGHRARLRALPEAPGAARPEGRHDVGRRAADVRDRARADGAAEAAPARRALARARADLRRADLRDREEINEQGTSILLVEQNAADGPRPRATAATCWRPGGSSSPTRPRRSRPTSRYARPTSAKADSGRRERRRPS